MPKPIQRIPSPSAPASLSAEGIEQQNRRRVQRALQTNAKRFGKPILLIQWLAGEEYKEVVQVQKSFDGEAEIEFVEAITKEDVRLAIERWSDGNGNRQYLFIGSHGHEPIGPGYSKGLMRENRSPQTLEDLITWEELRDWLKRYRYYGELWLGACRSAEAATAWNALLKPTSVPRYFYGFESKVPGIVVEKILRLLLHNVQRIGEPASYLDVEIHGLRETVVEALSENERLQRNFSQADIKLYHRNLAYGRGKLRDTDRWSFLTNQTFHAYLVSEDNRKRRDANKRNVVKEP